MIKNKGFTVVELLVIIFLIALLSAIVIINYYLARGKARDSNRKTDMREIEKAIELYAEHNKGQYPDLDNWSTESGGSNWSNLSGEASDVLEPYLSPLPLDPKNNCDQQAYLCSNTQMTSYYVYSNKDDSCFAILAGLETDTGNGSEFQNIKTGCWDNGLNQISPQRDLDYIFVIESH